MSVMEGQRSEKAAGHPARITIAFAALIVVAMAGTRVVAPSDVQLYQHYAHAMLHGSFTAGLPKEYPALAGLFFLGVTVIPGGYVTAFAICIAICLGLLLFWGSRTVQDDGWAQRLLLYLALGVATVMLFRFDVLPAACAFVAVVYARRERYGHAWCAAWLGAALKIFPGLLLPGFFIYEWRRTGRPPWRRAAMAGAAAAAVAGLQALLAPGTFLGPFRYEAQRGFEFSSVPGSLSLILSRGHLTWQFGFGNWQVLGPAHSEIAALMAVAELGGMIAIWWWLARRRLGLEAASLAVLSIAVLTDRSLAPQYLIWLAPLWALWPLRRSWMAACLLTFLTFPVALELHAVYGMSAMLPAVVGAIRNLVLFGGTAAWLGGELRGATISSQPELKVSSIPAFGAEGPSIRIVARGIVGVRTEGVTRGRDMQITGLTQDAGGRIAYDHPEFLAHSLRDGF